MLPNQFSYSVLAAIKLPVYSALTYCSSVLIAAPPVGPANTTTYLWELNERNLQNMCGEASPYLPLPCIDQVLQC